MPRIDAIAGRVLGGVFILLSAAALLNPPVTDAGNPEWRLALLLLGLPWTLSVRWLDGAGNSVFVFLSAAAWFVNLGLIYALGAAFQKIYRRTVK